MKHPRIFTKKILLIFHRIKEPKIEPTEITKNSNIYKLTTNNPREIDNNPKNTDKKIMIEISLYFLLIDNLNKSLINEENVLKLPANPKRNKTTNSL